MRSSTLGLAWVHFDEGHGGLGLKPRLQKPSRNGSPRPARPHPYGRNPIGYGMGAPTVVTHGTTAQRERYLRPLFTGEEVWCQLFSEPGAGSDVAGLATKAVRDGDEWIVNGQKVWTTLAHLSRWGMLVARTDPEPAQAQGHDLLRRRHARAGRRGAAAAPDHRRGRVQRGLSSPTSASPMPSGSATSARAGGSRSPP